MYLKSGLRAAFAWLAGFAVASAFAGPISTLDNPDELAPFANLITFQGQAVFSQPTSVGGVGLVLSNGKGPDVAFDPSPPREFGPAEGTIIQNIASSFIPLNMNFAGPINQLGFEMRTLAFETITLTFTSSGNTVQTLSFATRDTTSDPNSELYFYGFQSTVPFDHVLLNVSGPQEGFFEIDNLRFDLAVPEATRTWPLLAVGLAGCWVGRRKWRLI